MRATHARGGADPTFTEVARRNQIVQATIATLAEAGYPQTSLTAIARRAELSSTGLITYHFGSKSALIEQVVAHVLDHIAGYLAARTPESTDPRRRLRAYVTASVDYIREHTAEMRALLAIFLSGAMVYDGATNPVTVAPLERILADGQRAGVFRTIDVSVVSALIQRSIDGLPLALERDPDLDLDAYAESLLTLVENGLIAD